MLSITHIINENGGWAAFPYTPRGQNHGYQLITRARASEKWYVDEKDVTETKRHDGTPVITEEAIQDDRDSGMPEELIQQEYYLSFKGFQQGGYFTDVYDQAELDGRFTDVPWMPAYPVYLACDLGIGVKFAIWCWQRILDKIHVIKYHTLETGGIPEFAKWVKMQLYVFEKFYAPFDIASREIATGVSRLETARAYDIHFKPVPLMRVEERVNAGRMIFPLCYFDRKNCEKGLQSLLSYRREYDEKRQEYKREELHDWASHGGSAFCYMGVANKDAFRIKKVHEPQFAETAFDPFNYETYETDFSPFE